MKYNLHCGIGECYAFGKQLNLQRQASNRESIDPDGGYEHNITWLHMISPGLEYVRPNNGLCCRSLQSQLESQVELL